MAYDGSWTGKVLIQLGNEQEVQQLHSVLHGKWVEVQQHLASIAVDSLHLDLGTPATHTQAQSR